MDPILLKKCIDDTANKFNMSTDTIIKILTESSVLSGKLGKHSSNHTNTTVCFNISSLICESFFNEIQKTIGQTCNSVSRIIADNLLKVSSTKIFSNPYQSILELPVNSIDSINASRNGNSQKSLGKFGLGFFSILYWVVNFPFDDNYVVVSYNPGGVSLQMLQSPQSSCEIPRDDGGYIIKIVYVPEFTDFYVMTPEKLSFFLDKHIPDHNLSNFFKKENITGRKFLENHGYGLTTTHTEFISGLLQKHKLFQEGNVGLCVVPLKPNLEVGSVGESWNLGMEFVGNKLYDALIPTILKYKTTIGLRIVSSTKTTDETKHHGNGIAGGDLSESFEQELLKLRYVKNIGVILKSYTAKLEYRSQNTDGPAIQGIRYNINGVQDKSGSDSDFVSVDIFMLQNITTQTSKRYPMFIAVCDDGSGIPYEILTQKMLIPSSSSKQMISFPPKSFVPARESYVNVEIIDETHEEFINRKKKAFSSLLFCVGGVVVTSVYVSSPDVVCYDVVLFFDSGTPLPVSRDDLSLDVLTVRTTLKRLLFDASDRIMDAGLSLDTFFELLDGYQRRNSTEYIFEITNETYNHVITKDSLPNIMFVQDPKTCDILRQEFRDGYKFHLFKRAPFSGSFVKLTQILANASSNDKVGIWKTQNPSRMFSTITLVPISQSVFHDKYGYFVFFPSEWLNRSDGINKITERLTGLVAIKQRPDVSYEHKLIDLLGYSTVRSRNENLFRQQMKYITNSFPFRRTEPRKVASRNSRNTGNIGKLLYTEQDIIDVCMSIASFLTTMNDGETVVASCVSSGEVYLVGSNIMIDIPGVLFSCLGVFTQLSDIIDQTFKKFWQTYKLRIMNFFFNMKPIFSQASQNTFLFCPFFIDPVSRIEPALFDVVTADSISGSLKNARTVTLSKDPQHQPGTYVDALYFLGTLNECSALVKRIVRVGLDECMNAISNKSIRKSQVVCLFSNMFCPIMLIVKNPELFWTDPSKAKNMILRKVWLLEMLVDIFDSVFKCSIVWLLIQRILPKLKSLGLEGWFADEHQPPTQRSAKSAPNPKSVQKDINRDKERELVLFIKNQLKQRFTHKFFEDWAGYTFYSNTVEMVVYADKYEKAFFIPMLETMELHVEMKSNLNLHEIPSNTTNLDTGAVTTHTFFCSSLIKHIFETQTNPAFEFNNVGYSKLKKFTKGIHERTPSEINLQIIQITTNAGTTKDFIPAVLTELVQNSKDAILGSKIPVSDEIDIGVTLKTLNSTNPNTNTVNTANTVLWVKDGVGISQEHVLGLLIPFYSSKTSSDVNVVGEMGTGFFNVYRQPYTQHIEIRTNTILIVATPITTFSPKTNGMLVSDIRYEITYGLQHHQGTVISIHIVNSGRDQQNNTPPNSSNGGLVGFSPDPTQDIVLSTALYSESMLGFIPVNVRLFGKLISQKKTLFYEDEYIRGYKIQSSRKSVVLTNGIPLSELSTFLARTYGDSPVQNEIYAAYDYGVCIDIKKGWYTPTQSRNKLVYFGKWPVKQSIPVLFDMWLYNVISEDITDNPNTNSFIFSEYFPTGYDSEDISQYNVLPTTKSSPVLSTHRMNVNFKYCFTTAKYDVYHYITLILRGIHIIKQSERYNPELFATLRQNGGITTKTIQYTGNFLKNFWRSSGKNGTDGMVCVELIEYFEKEFSAIPITWLTTKTVSVTQLPTRMNRDVYDSKPLDNFGIVLIERFLQFFVEEYYETGKKIVSAGLDWKRTPDVKIIRTTAKIYGYYVPSAHTIHINLEMIDERTFVNSITSKEMTTANSANVLSHIKNDVQLFSYIGIIRKSATMPHEIQHALFGNSHEDGIAHGNYSFAIGGTKYDNAPFESCVYEVFSRIIENGFWARFITKWNEFRNT